MGCLLGCNGGVHLNSILGTRSDALAPITNGIYELGRILLGTAAFRHIGGGSLSVAASRGSVKCHLSKIVNVMKQADGPRGDDVLNTIDGEGVVVRALETFGDGEQLGLGRAVAGQHGGEQEGGQEGEGRSGHACKLKC